MHNTFLASEWLARPQQLVNSCRLTFSVYCLLCWWLDCKFSDRWPCARRTIVSGRAFLCVCDPKFRWSRRPVPFPVILQRYRLLYPMRYLQLLNYISNLQWLSGRRNSLHTNILFGAILCVYTESNDIFFVDRSGYHVQFSRTVDIAEQFFVKFIRTD